MGQSISEQEVTQVTHHVILDAVDTGIVLMSPKALAKRWGVTAQHLANLRYKGESPLGYVKLGGRVAYRVDEVEAHEHDQYVPAGGAA